MAGPPLVSAARPARARYLTAVACVGYAAVASGVRTLTWTASLAVLLPAAVVATVAVRRHQPDLRAWDPATRRGVWIWGALILASLLWEAWAFVNQPSVTVASYTHPSLSSLVGPWLHDRAARFAAWLLWLYAGWRLTRPVRR